VKELNEMKFKRYNDIENVERKQTLEYIREGQFDQGIWEVREKVHGQNMQISKDSEGIQWGKRSGLISPDSNFGGFLVFKNKLEVSINCLYDYVIKELKSGHVTVRIFGENCGGEYKHEKVEPIKTAMKIQHGVWYSPDNQFLAFDIMVNEEFVSGREFDMYCKLFDIPYLPILFRGTFDECLEYNPLFESLVYQQFNLPKIDNNFAEGVVIKPDKPKWFHNKTRVILKNKTEKFKEVSRNRNKEKKQCKFEDLSPEFHNLVTEMEKYVTPNRLVNVLSKMGDITDKDFRKIIKELSTDVMKDFLKDFTNQFSKLGGEQGLFYKKCGQLSSELLRPNFRNIIDGTFDPFKDEELGIRIETTINEIDLDPSDTVILNDVGETFTEHPEILKDVLENIIIDKSEIVITPIVKIDVSLENKEKNDLED